MLVWLLAAWTPIALERDYSLQTSHIDTGLIRQRAEIPDRRLDDHSLYTHQVSAMLDLTNALSTNSAVHPPVMPR